MVTKKFDKQLFAENDRAARGAVAEHLQSRGLRVEPHPNTYSVDLLVFESATGKYPDYAVECEIKRVWSGDKFPWDSIQIPYRKRKYFSIPETIEFYILNAEMTHAVVVHENVLLDHDPIVVPNKYVPQGELFWQVPLSECNLIQLERAQEKSE